MPAEWIGWIVPIIIGVMVAASVVVAGTWMLRSPRG